MAVIQKVANIFLAAGKEIINTNNIVPILQEPITQVRS
jgi:hypothetical protein